MTIGKLVDQTLGLRVDHWPSHGVASLLLIVVLVGVGRRWLEVKRAWRRARLPPVAGQTTR